MSDLSTSNRGGLRARRAWRWFRNAVLDSRYVADPEWLIGLGRLVTAAFAAIAIYFDPTQPGRLADEARLLTLGYVVFALLALIPIRRPVDSRLHLLTHAADIVVLGWLLHLTDELTSPFFAFFHFTLFAAAIRWGMTGALLGAVVLELLLFVIGLPDLEDGVSELNLMIMRSAYFLVAAFMLGYFGAYRSRSRHRLARLAAWPRVQPVRDDAWLRDILAHAFDVLRAERLVVAWQDADEAGGTVATYAQNSLATAEVHDVSLWSTVDGGERGGDAALLAALDRSLDRAAPVRNHIENVSAAAIAGLRYRGHLLVVNARYPHEEIGSLAAIVASRISYELERRALMREVATSARVQERVRLARDLHDSVLQDLTAAGLKLKAAARGVAPEVEPLLDDVAQIIADQQRRIRGFVEGTRVGASDTVRTSTLARYVEQLERQWDCEIHLTTHPEGLCVSEAMADDLAQIISEATSNAVRHGAATRVDLAVTLQHGTLRLGIADNGTGVADDAAAAARRPLSLGARVADLAGKLAVVRQRPGFALLIELPAV